jgi:DNA-binding CsgD family transcriptional regulator
MRFCAAKQDALCYYIAASIHSLIKGLPLQFSPEINQLILSIYQGVLDEQPWSGFVNALRTSFNADVAALTIIARHSQSEKYLVRLAISRDNTPLDYNNHWLALDPFQAIASNTPTLLQELNPEQAIEQNDYYQDLIKPTGMYHFLAMNVEVAGSPQLLIKIRLARKPTQYDFNQQDKALLASLSDHIKLALRFLDEMAIKQIERNAFADAINQFMLGTLIVDRQGKIVASNRVARETIDNYHQLSIEHGALIISDPRVHQQLYQALQDIDSDDTKHPLPRTLSIKLDDSMALGLMIRPVRPEDALAYPAHAHAVVFLSDPKWTPDISAATLRELFGFTEGESKVAAFLANGYTLNEAADKLCISVNTAKSHARCIYEKTGVNKQTKLIQLISNSVARVS